jgi:hypothetical protein
VKICHASRYQSRLSLAERVKVLDSTGWRPAGEEELTTICADAGDVSVVAIPRHLLKRWWSMAESDDDFAHTPAGFESYAREIAEYFNYKRWDLPADAVMEVVVADSAKQPPQSSRATRFSGGIGKLLACLNLGDENIAIDLDEDPTRIRVVLEAGEGVMLPSAGIWWSRSALDGTELTVTLLIGTLSSQ